MGSDVVVTLDLWLFATVLACALGLGALILRVWQAMAGRGFKQAPDAGLIHTLYDRNLVGNACKISLDQSGCAEVQPDTDQGARQDSMVRAKIEHLDHILGAKARRQVMDHVARIMQRSVRKHGRFASHPGDLVQEIEGDGFIILVRGANESQAAIVARRLRSELARADIEGLAPTSGMSARFGVSSRRMGEELSQWRSRTEEALAFAAAPGGAHIMEASIVEARKQLPAPAPSPADRQDASKAA